MDSASTPSRTPLEFVLHETPMPEHRALIEASAGTGKTYTIAGLFVRLVAEENLKVGEILVVTFTEAATAELRTRIRAALRAAAEALVADEPPEEPLHRRLWDSEERDRLAANLRAGLREFDDASIATIHGFCLRALERAALQAGVPFRLQLLADDGPMLRRAVEDWWRRRVQCGSRTIVDTVRAASWNVDTLARLYRDLRRNPGAEILPPAPALADAEAAVSPAAMQTAFEDSELGAALRAVTWLKPGMPFGARDADALLDAIGERLQGPGFLEVAQEFAPRGFATRVGKGRSKVQKAGYETLAAHPFVRACAEVAAAGAALRSALRADLHESVSRGFRGELQRAESLGFDELLTTVRDALLAPGGERLREHLAKIHPAVLVDEFQDTDAVQWEIFSTAFGQGRLFLIGDPKQSIYGFRGADLHTYLAARETCAQQFTLTANYRSRQELLDGLNELFDRPAPFLVDGLDYPRVHSGRGESADRLRDPDRDGSLCWLWAAQPDKNDIDLRRASCIATTVCEVRRLLDHATLRTSDEEAPEPLRARDIGILVRKNAEAQALRDALAKAGIPAALGKGQHIRDSVEMDELRHLARAIAEPRRRGATRAAFLTLLWGDTADDLTRLDAPGHEVELEQRIAFLEDCRQLWIRQGFVRAIQRVLDARGSKARLARLEQGERRLTNLLQSIEVVHALATARSLSPSALVAALADPRSFDVLDGGESTEMRLETDRDAVQILTMHRAKGLQYPVVFCPFLWTGQQSNAKTSVLRWHDAKGWHLRLQAEPEETEGALADARSAHDAGELADALRLAYVALTRAEQRVYVLAPMHPQFAASPLGYLLHRPETGASGSETVRARRAAESWKGSGSAMGELAILERLAPHAIRVEEFDGTDDSIPEAMGVADAAAEEWTTGPVPDDGPQLRPWITTSFTGLVRGAHDPADPADRDDPETPSEPDAPTAPLRADDLLGFARGAAAGTCLHAVLEKVDLRAPGAPSVATVVGDELRRARLDDPRRHPTPLDPLAAVVRMVADVATAPLPASFGRSADGAARRLADLPPGRDLAEWRFHLQMAHGAGDDLVDVFAEHGGEVARRYAEHLRLLLPERRSAALRGYLTGSIDLVLAFDDDRHWVVDWKSNHLGPRREDHAGAALEVAMFEHHYVLQYHLYLLALHRHLRARRPGDYDYEQHIGGAGYAFLRGIGPDGGGWFVDRPPRALIEALDAFVGHAQGVRP